MLWIDYMTSDTFQLCYTWWLMVSDFMDMFNWSFFLVLCSLISHLSYVIINLFNVNDSLNCTEIINWMKILERFHKMSSVTDFHRIIAWESISDGFVYWNISFWTHQCLSVRIFLFIARLNWLKWIKYQHFD